MGYGSDYMGYGSANMGSYYMGPGYYGSNYMYGSTADPYYGGSSYMGGNDDCRVDYPGQSPYGYPLSSGERGAFMLLCTAVQEIDMNASNKFKKGLLKVIKDNSRPEDRQCITEFVQSYCGEPNFDLSK